MPSLVRRAALPLLLCTVTTAAGAQRAAGAGEDAYVLPRWGTRWSLAADFASWRDLYTPTNDRLGVGDRLGGTLDATRLSSLAAAQSQLRTITGSATTTLSLGDVRVTADARRTTVPLQAELGVGMRLAIGVNVPFVRTRVDVVPNANGAYATATAGANPALTVTAARDTNATLVAQLRDAAIAYERTNGCTGAPTSGGCAVVAETRAVASAIEALYGGAVPPGGSSGAIAVPITGSAAQRAVAARINDLRVRLGESGAGITVAEPAAARTAIGLAGFQSVLTDLGLDPVRDVERVHVGDVEVQAKLKLFDGIGHPGDQARGPLALRGAVTGLVRLPTGQADSPTNALDVGTGDGQLDLELRGALDLTLGRAFWVSGVARAVMQREDEQYVRVPSFAGEQPFVPAGAMRKVRRDLGDAMELEVTPRWMPSEYFSVAAQYHYLSKKEDVYADLVTGDDPIGTSGTTLLGIGTAAYTHTVGAGFTYSTLGAARRGRHTLPLDVTFMHRQTVRSTGGWVPALTSDAVRVRVWPGRFTR